MAHYPPFMNATGLTSKILKKLMAAQTPDRFTHDFLANKLGFSGGSAKAFVPLAKRIGLLSSDGTPTDLYKRFRNPRQSKAAMAEAIKKGYTELYSRDESAHELTKAPLDGLIVEATGLAKDHGTVTAIRGTFEALKKFADFGAAPPGDEGNGAEEEEVSDTGKGKSNLLPALGVSYQINLVLPKTDDVAVFNAIFKSLRENLLRK